MAEPGGESPSWAAFAAGDLATGLARVRGLSAAEPDEAAPFAHLYAASDLLADLGSRAAAIAAAGGRGALIAAACAARLALERGLTLLQTDLLHEGEPLVAAALTSGAPAAAPLPLLAALRARNALGAIWCDRGDDARALEHLAAADALYQAARGVSSGGGAGTEQQVAGETGAAVRLASMSLEEGAGCTAAAAAGAAAASEEQAAGEEQAAAAAGEAAAGEEAAPGFDWQAALDPEDVGEGVEDAYTQTRESWASFSNAVLRNSAQRWTACAHQQPAACVARQPHDSSRFSACSYAARNRRMPPLHPHCLTSRKSTARRLT